MQYTGSDLEYLVPLWNRELPNRINQPVRDSLFGRDVHVFGATIYQNIVGNAGPLAQDVFRACIISQGAIEGALD